MKLHRSEKLEKDDRPPCHEISDDGVEEEPEVSDVTLSTLRSEGQKKKGKTAVVSGWGTPVAEDAPVLGDRAPTPVHVTRNMGLEWPRCGAWNFGATSGITAESRNAVGEVIPAEGPCFAAPADVSRTDEPYIDVQEEEPLPEDRLPATEAFSKEDSTGKEKAALQATTKASQAELIVEGFIDAEEHILNQNDNVPNNLDDAYESTPEDDVAPIHSAPAEDAEFLVSSPKPALCTGRDKSDFHPSAPLSTVTSILEATAPEAPTKDSHTITLKILNGTKVLRSIVFITACTRTAILNEAKAYCVKYAQGDQSFRRLLPKRWDLTLLSLKMYGCDMDLSIYKVENLSSLVQTVEKTGIPRFTLRVSEM